MLEEIERDTSIIDDTLIAGSNTDQGHQKNNELQLKAKSLEVLT